MTSFTHSITVFLIYFFRLTFKNIFTGSSSSSSSGLARGSGMPVQFEKAPASKASKRKRDEFASFLGGDDGSSGGGRKSLRGVGTHKGSSMMAGASSHAELAARNGKSRNIGFTSGSSK